MNLTKQALSHEDNISIIGQISQHPTYKQLLKDSCGGVLYNVANHSKYQADEILNLWNALDKSYQSSAGGIMKAAMNFLKTDNQ